jgi:translation initiation factor IF-2
MLSLVSQEVLHNTLVHTTLDNGQKIAFLDTPGHEAYCYACAWCATDIAIIVIAADDDTTNEGSNKPCSSSRCSDYICYQ